MLAPQTVRAPQCSHGGHFAIQHVRIVQDIEGVVLVSSAPTLLRRVLSKPGIAWEVLVLKEKSFLLLEGSLATRMVNSLALHFNIWTKIHTSSLQNIINRTPWMLCFLTHREACGSQSQTLDTTHLSTFRILLYCHRVEAIIKPWLLATRVCEWPKNT